MGITLLLVKKQQRFWRFVPDMPLQNIRLPGKHIWKKWMTNKEQPRKRRFSCLVGTAFDFLISYRSPYYYFYLKKPRNSHGGGLDGSCFDQVFPEQPSPDHDAVFVDKIRKGDHEKRKSSGCGKQGTNQQDSLREKWGVKVMFWCFSSLLISLNSRLST